MNAHWPKHKEYHKEQKERAERRREGTMRDLDRSLAEQVARRAEETGDEFGKRCAAAVALGAEGNYHAAVKAWRKLVKERPDHGAAHFNLGVVLERSSRWAEAAQMHLKAMELFEDGTERWATSAAEAFDLLKLDGCREAPKP